MVRTSYTVGQYLVDRLRALGVRHLFSVSGPCCAEWLHHYVESTPSIQRFATATAANTGYAADGYARLNGIGAACVPHSVGAFPLLSPIAGAFVERVPVVVVNGAPAPSASPCERPRPNIGGPDGNRQVYDSVTAATTSITSPERAPTQIDRTLRTCLRARRPVYLEPRADVLHCPCPPPDTPLSISTPSAPSSTEARATIADHLREAGSTVVWGGIEIQRYGLEREFADLLQALDVPYVTSLLGKGLLPEDHPQFAGVLAPEGTPPALQSLVSSADYVLGLGVDPSAEPCPPSVQKTGAATFVTTNDDSPAPGADEPRLVRSSGSHLQTLLTNLTQTNDSCHPPRTGPTVAARTRQTVTTDGPTPPTSPEADITYDGFYHTVADYVTDNTIVVGGTGLDRFGSRQLRIPSPSGFVCQAAYRDVGHAPPAAIGADLASDDERVLVIVGDGGFQMTAQCVGTMAEKGIDPILFVLNNGVYGSEQRRLNADTFTEDAPVAPQALLQQWHYRKLPDAMGGKGWRAETVGELTAAVEEAFKYTGGPLLIDVRVAQRSLPHLAIAGLDAPERDRESTLPSVSSP